MNLPAVFRRSKQEERDTFPSLTIDDYLSMFSWNGVSYMPGSSPSLAGKTEPIENNFLGYVQQAYKANGPVFTCMLVRSLLFSEVRFQFRRIRYGRPGDLWGNPDLQILETPWPNGTTGDLLARMIQDVDLSGNFYGLRVGDEIRRLRPDWTDIILGGDYPGALNTSTVGYAYWPEGKRQGQESINLPVSAVAHYAPIPDPEANYRGMSWLTPIGNEITADKGMTHHKQKFLDNGATPSLIGTLPITNQDDYDRWVRNFRTQNEGIQNAYRTLWLGAGADVKALGTNFQEFDFKVVQGAGETRIAAAAGVPPVIAGFSEGLASATYSNYGLAMRRFTDLTMRPLWRNAAASLAPIITVPSDSILWYDDRDVPALSEDSDKRAAIQQQQAQTIHIYVSAGFTPDSAVEAVTSNDTTKLAHTGMFSVQLQPAGSVTQGKGAVVAGTVLPSGKPPLPAALEGQTGANGAAMSRAEAETATAQITEGEQ